MGSLSAAFHSYKFLRSSLPVRYETRSQKLKLRMRNVRWVRVYCKICKNSLHESWHANNQIYILLSLHTAAFLGFGNKNVLYFLQLYLRLLSLSLFVATVLTFLKHDNALINFYSKLSGSSVCILQFISCTGWHTYMYTNNFKVCLSCAVVND